MSVDYYTRLEQSRGPHPSRQVLTGLARALRLSDDERMHLFYLAGEQPDRPTGPSTEVRAGIRHLVENLDDTPAMVIDAKFEVLAWNALGAALLTDFSALTPRDRNLARMRFLSGTMDCLRFDPVQAERFARDLVADLRAASARYPRDPDIAELITELLDHSEEFGQLWADHEVGNQRSMCTAIQHPVVGRLDLVCEMLTIPDRGQRLILYTAEPGSPSYDALQLLKVVGTQDLTFA